MLVFILAFAPKVLGSSIPHIGDDYKHLNEYIIHNESLVVFFVFLSLAMGSIMKEINRATAIPYSPMLFFAGILAGYYWESLGVIGKSCKLVSDINPNGVLIIFLPVLIYEAGFKFDWHIFKKLFI